MKVMIDILHPAHVHFFRNFIQEMQKDGHDLLITARNKEMTLTLLQEYDIPYTLISTVKKGFLGRFQEQLQRSLKFYQLARKFKPDLLISEQGVTTAPLGKILRIPSLIFWDTEVSTLTNKVCYPLATAVYTPISYTGKVRGNHLTYQGYQKLAYLHPNWYVPNPTTLQKYKLQRGKYCILRFVSWTSNHDAGDHGIIDKVKFVEELQKSSSVYISSEENLPPELEKYKLNIDYRDIFDILAFASLYIGESATMATEAAVLGTPSIYVATSERGYINELQQKYQLVQWHKDEESALQQATLLLQDKKTKLIWKKRREDMLQEVIDLTAFMIDLVKNKKYL